MAFCGLGVKEGVWARARICVFIPPERKLAGWGGGVYWNHCVLKSAPLPAEMQSLLL